MVRRGRDRHLHGQRFLPPGIRRRHSQRCLAEPLSTNEKKGATPKPVATCSRRRYKDILPSTPGIKVSPVGFHNTCSLTLWCTFPPSGFHSADVAPLTPRFRKLLDQTVKTVFPSCLLLLDCDDNWVLSVPLSTSDFHYSRWQSGENLPGVVHQGLHVVLPRVHDGTKEDFLSSFVTFVLLPCPRVCLLDVSRLLGLMIGS